MVSLPNTKLGNEEQTYTLMGDKPPIRWHNTVPWGVILIVIPHVLRALLFHPIMNLALSSSIQLPLFPFRRSFIALALLPHRIQEGSRSVLAVDEPIRASNDPSHSSNLFLWLNSWRSTLECLSTLRNLAPHPFFLFNQLIKEPQGIWFGMRSIALASYLNASLIFISSITQQWPL